MREILSRMRASLPAAAGVLLAVLISAFLLMSMRDDQSSSLEKRIARTLSSVEGAGKVEVTILEREIPSSGSSFSAKAGRRIPGGAVAVAQGADDPMVVLALQEALCALLGLSPACVSVISGGN